MTDLPDINVWLALSDGNHEHHSVARRYWEETDTIVAFCRLTMLGLLRLATHPKAMHGRPFSAPEAWRAYRRFAELPEVRFLPEPLGVERGFRMLTDDASFPNSIWTEAYLAAFAMETGCRVVSFDSDFHRFPSLAFLHLKP